MKILITGGTGFIGSHLVQALLKEGHHPVLLSRDADSATKRFQKCSNLPVYQWNSLTEETPEEAFEGVDAIINLAGENIASGRWTEKKKRAIQNSRITGTRNLLAPLQHLKKKPRLLLSASAVGYYGECGDNIRTESSPAGEGFLAETCKCWEEEAGKAEAYGLAVCRVRIGIVLGKEGGALQKMLPPFKLGLGGKSGSGLQWMSWIHKDDLIRLLLFALHHNVPPVLNAVAPEPVCNKEFSRTLAAVLHRPAFFSVPAFVLKAGLGEMASLLLEGQKVYPQATLASGFQFQYPVLQGALSAILK